MCILDTSASQMQARHTKLGVKAINMLSDRQFSPNLEKHFLLEIRCDLSNIYYNLPLQVFERKILKLEKNHTTYFQKKRRERL